MNQNYFFIAFLFAASLFLTACPYASSVPIDEPNIKIDKSLLGKWIKAADLTSDNPTFYEVEKMNKYKYKMFENTYSTSDETYSKKFYMLHLSKINNTIFVNMQKEGAGDYSLYKLDKGDGEMTLYEITNNIDDKFNTPNELKAYIKKICTLVSFLIKMK